MQIVRENINFTRSQDPKVAMDVGFPSLKLIEKIDVLAKEYNFIKVPFNESDKKINRPYLIQKWEKKGILLKTLILFSMNMESNFYTAYYNDDNGYTMVPPEKWFNKISWEEFVRHMPDKF